MPIRVLLNTRQNSSCFKLLLFFTERGVTFTLRILPSPPLGQTKKRSIRGGGVHMLLKVYQPTGNAGF